MTCGKQEKGFTFELASDGLTLSTASLAQNGWLGQAASRWPQDAGSLLEVLGWELMLLLASQI